MNDKDIMKGLTRRTFLAYSGALIASVTTPSFAFAGVSDNDSDGLSGRFRIGVMLPRSSISPVIADNYLAGMNICFDRLRNGTGKAEIEIVKEEIGHSLPVSAFSRLVQKERIDLVAGLVNGGVAGLIGKYCKDDKTVFVASNVGECLIREEDQSPTVFHCTLNKWQADWALGSWAAGFGKRAFIASSLYDSGYDIAPAFRLGFESAGGRVVGSHIFMKGISAERDLLYSGIVASRPDLVYGLFSGNEAVEFVRCYAALGLAGSVPLFGSGFTLDDKALKGMGHNAKGIRTCLPWSRDLASSENAAFVSSFRNRTGRMPEAFGLLGYETAACIVEALKKTGGKTGTDLLAGAFRTVKFASPRGTIKMNPATRTTSGPVFTGEVMLMNNRPSFAGADRYLSVADTDSRLKQLNTTARTGWNNAYLC